ncbi:MAG TPA: lytic murein transglycosylase B [Steroidobacteraceae bacterium]
MHSLLSLKKPSLLAATGLRARLIQPSAVAVCTRVLLLAAVVLCVSVRPATAVDLKRPEVKDFIAHMVAADSYNKRHLRKLLKAAKSQPAIIEAMDRPAEKAKLWYEYRPIFLTEKRIREGTDFWIAHRQALDQASVRSGVAPQYLAAILGVETYYGRQTGSYRVLDALATLAFDYPARAQFFSDELEQYLLLARDMGLDPLKVKGSYAGAMGAPQFMPSNYRRYAVDADGDGHIDLWTNWDDVCASVGNYLKEHGWNNGEPVLTDAQVGLDKPPDLDGRKLVLSETVGSLTSKGVSFDSMLPPNAPALLIAADETDGTHWRVGYNNFYVITRYNHSAMYAMAVYELAAAVKQRMLLHDAPPTAAANLGVAAGTNRGAATGTPIVVNTGNPTSPASTPQPAQP